jgi:gamma-glutamyltranspeptidase/glutathione hydrolase
MHQSAVYVALILFMTAPAFSQDRSQARSLVISQRGIAATSQTLASQAGAQILSRGGNAVDAAIAANATLAVVEPMMNGIGGDLSSLFATARPARSPVSTPQAGRPKE